MVEAEQQRLVACGAQLDAKGAIRWAPDFESGAILCEELAHDRLTLAGAYVRISACLLVWLGVCVWGGSSIPRVMWFSSPTIRT